MPYGDTVVFVVVCFLEKEAKSSCYHMSSTELLITSNMMGDRVGRHDLTKVVLNDSYYNNVDY